MAAKFKAMADRLDCSYDRFIRTTDADHLPSTQELWRRMQEKGDIYLSKYSGWYSVRDEAYYDESELTKQPDGSWRAPDRHACRMDRGGELFLPPLRLSGPSAGALRGQPGFHQPGDPAQRDHELRPLRPAGSLDQPHDLQLGPAGAGRSEARHVRVDRCAQQLRDGLRLPG